MKQNTVVVSARGIGNTEDLEIPRTTAPRATERGRRLARCDDNQPTPWTCHFSRDVTGTTVRRIGGFEGV